MPEFLAPGVHVEEKNLLCGLILFREPAPSTPLVGVWPYALVFWLVFAWGYAPELRMNWRSRTLPRPQDAKSALFTLVVQSAGVSAAFVIAFVARFGILARRQLWFWLGLGLLAAGSLLRRHCFRMLGSSFTAVVVVKPGQAVVDRGAYRWVRHPAYTAAALFLVGIAVALGNWAGIAVVFSAVVLSFAYRVRVEERALAATLGEPYLAYMRRTKRFIPMVM